jgi:hypothetical protein
MIVALVREVVGVVDLRIMNSFVFAVIGLVSNLVMLVTLHQILFTINGVGFFQRHAFFI